MGLLHLDILRPGVGRASAALLWRPQCSRVLFYRLTGLLRFMCFLRYWIIFGMITWRSYGALGFGDVWRSVYILLYVFDKLY